MWRGELLEVLEPSPARRTPVCPIADQCGGCDWLHVDETVQRAAKEEIVLSALEHLGRIPRDSFRLLPTLHAAAHFGYRRRAVLHASREGVGFFVRRSHQLVPVELCGALTQRLADLPGRLGSMLLPIRSEIEEIHLLESGGRASMAVRLRGPVKPRLQELVERALREVDLAGAVIVPSTGASVLLGRPTLSQPAPLRPDVTLYLRPDAFSQAHAEGNVLLVGAAIEALEPRREDSVLELYAGNGNFTFALAERVAEVTAVESGNVSVELARRSTQEAKVPNVRWVLGDAIRVCEGLVRERRRFDVLLADPPRTGAPGLAAIAQGLGVRRVVYVACDPGSLARDGAALIASGYAPTTLQLVDMFPQTHHLEVVASFSRGA